MRLSPGRRPNGAGFAFETTCRAKPKAGWAEVGMTPAVARREIAVDGFIPRS
jgi:hypothetical protein